MGIVRRINLLLSSLLPASPPPAGGRVSPQTKQKEVLRVKQKTFIYTGWESPKVGDEVILIERTNILSGNSSWGFISDPEGVGGNMDRSKKMFHGWRGTTDDVALYAHGLRKVLKVTPIGVDEDGDDKYKITVRS
jgi:hypothetical protein